MDGAAYVMTRLDYLRDPITEQRARELYEAAQARVGADLTGDLASGFGFFATATAEGLPLVRVRVERLTGAALGGWGQ